MTERGYQMVCPLSLRLVAAHVPRHGSSVRCGDTFLYGRTHALYEPHHFPKGKRFRALQIPFSSFMPFQVVFHLRIYLIVDDLGPLFVDSPAVEDLQYMGRGAGLCLSPLRQEVGRRQMATF